MTPTASASLTPLPTLPAQAERLITLGLTPHDDADALRAAATHLSAAAPNGSLLVVHERIAPPSQLAPYLSLPAPGRAGAAGQVRQGFVVTDMSDVDEFRPVSPIELPDTQVYAVTGLDRGDDLRNWSPNEAKPVLLSRNRSPLTLTEGIHWALQVPEIIEANHCFMTIGSRLTKPNGKHDARTPALWISSGTGRDGTARKGAPKVGWCWWGNRHTWLGIASCQGREPNPGRT